MAPTPCPRRAGAARSRRTLSRVAAGVAAAALACSRQATPPARAAAPDAAPPGAATPGPAAGNPPPRPEPVPAASAPDDASLPAPVPNATPAPAVPAPVTVAAAVAAGEEQPLARDGTTVIDPRSSFRLEVAAHLIDGRLALLDEHDAMVASSGTTEIGAASTRYELTPAEPLSPGVTYTIRLDGVSSREAHDPTGRAFTPVKLELRIAGERRRAPPARRRRPR